MGEIIDKLPEEIQNHIRNIAQNAGLPKDEESYDRIAQGWLDKKNAFEEQVIKQGLLETDGFSTDNENGGVALTYSGSLILIGPLVDGVRKSAYNSIGLRKDVPDSLTHDASVLTADIVIDSPIQFKPGPVQRTSPIYKFAICQSQLDALEQEEKISEATIIITKEFVDINKAMIPV